MSLIQVRLFVRMSFQNSHFRSQEQIKTNVFKLARDASSLGDDTKTRSLGDCAFRNSVSPFNGQNTLRSSPRILSISPADRPAQKWRTLGRPARTRHNQCIPPDQ